MKMPSWTFPGMYGDDESTVYIEKMPEELTAEQQESLRELYKIMTPQAKKKVIPIK